MEDNMAVTTSTVIGVFDDTYQAEQALGELTRIGIGEDRVEFVMSEISTVAGSYSAGGEPVHLSHETGQAVIRVNAEDRHQEVVDLLHRYGAFDVRETEPIDQQTSYFVGASSTDEPITAPFGQARAESAAFPSEAEPITGETWEEQSPFYRARWQRQYGTAGRRWEDYEDAYRFSWERSRSDEYSGRQWSDVEPDLKQDWEQHHHPSPWERIADAVKDAWQNIFGDRNRRDLDKAA